MSVERSLEGIQRHGQDIVERFSSAAHGLSSFVHGHMRNSELQREENGVPTWPWAWPGKRKGKSLDTVQFRRTTVPAADAPMGEYKGARIPELGQRLGQVGVEFGARLGGIVQNVVQHFPRPFQQEEGLIKQQFSDSTPGHMDYSARQRCYYDAHEEAYEFDHVRDGNDERRRASGHSDEPQVNVSITATYNSQTQDIESSVVATRDKWRAEVSLGGSSSGNTSGLQFLLQQCPRFFIRDSTLLLNLISTDQHSLWYGFDRKNGFHSFCPVVWSKHNKWRLLTMICINSLSCPFIDLQFPNGQVTYAAGEGLSTSAFVPVFGGFLQAQCRYPGETKLSFSCKNRLGTIVTPTVQWPDNSFSVAMVHPLAWKWLGPIFQPTIQMSVTPTFGGRNSGWKAEIVRTVTDKLSFTFGCASTIHPSAFASVSVRKSKQNGKTGNPGLVLRVESPLENVGRTSFSIQLSSGMEF